MFQKIGMVCGKGSHRESYPSVQMAVYESRAFLIVKQEASCLGDAARPVENKTEKTNTTTVRFLGV